MIKTTYAIYHETLGHCIEEVRRYSANTNVIVPSFENTWFNAVPYGTTLKQDWEIESIEGKGTKKWLHVSIYRLESGRYELTLYIL